MKNYGALNVETFDRMVKIGVTLAKKLAINGKHIPTSKEARLVDSKLGGKPLDKESIKVRTCLSMSDPTVGRPNYDACIVLSSQSISLPITSFFERRSSFSWGGRVAQQTPAWRKEPLFLLIKKQSQKGGKETR